MAITEVEVLSDCGVTWDDLPPAMDSAKAPEPEGVWDGVVAGLQYVGVQPSLYKADGQPTIFVGFEFECGGRRMSKWRRFNYTMNIKGAFYALVVSALGKTFPKRKDGGFDPRLLLGRPVMVEIVHTDKGGRTYADIGSVMRHHESMPALKPTVGFEIPQWVLDVKSKRLDSQPPVAVAPTAPAVPVPSTTSTRQEVDGSGA